MSRDRIILNGIAMLLGALQAFNGRHKVNSDGVSYLDMADGVFDGNLDKLLNGTWSPLYPLLLGVARALVRPAWSWEGLVVHAVHLAIFVLALAALHLFLTELSTYFRLHPPAEGRLHGGSEEFSLRLIGYGLFLWATLGCVTLALTSPDLLVLAFVYLEFGLLLRMLNRGWDTRSAFSFGVVAGAGYLAKTIMLPVGGAVLMAATYVGRKRGAALRFGMAAFSGVALTAGPYIAALSSTKGRVTFGDSWKYMYARNVNRLAVSVHWQGDISEEGRPLHPTRRLTTSPAIYEFADPLPGTYAAFFDPWYWYEGASTEFRLSNQLFILKRSLGMFLRMVGGAGVPGGAPLSIVVPAGLFLLLLAAGNVRCWLVELAKLWMVLAPALAALFLYVVVHVEPRYVSVFVAICYTILLASVCLSAGAAHLVPRLKAFAVLLFLAMVGSTAVDAGVTAAYGLYTGARRGDVLGKSTHMMVADHLRRSGVAPGSRIGFVGTSPLFYWARLAEVRVIAEIRQLRTPGSEAAHVDTLLIREYARRSPPDVDLFWRASPGAREHVMDVFRRTGVSAVVADEAPPAALEEGWLRLGNTPFHLFRFHGFSATAIQDPAEP